MAIITAMKLGLVTLEYERHEAYILPYALKINTPL